MGARRPPPRRVAPAGKREATRAKLLDRALALFQDRGVAGTTMRDIARAAGLSLGAAYYHFPSKEALIFAYYEANQDEMEAAAARATGDARARLAFVIHDKLRSLEPHRQMLAAIVQRLADPGDPVSAFSAEQRAVRERSIAVLAGCLADAKLPPAAQDLAARALWLLVMGLMLLAVHDDSPAQARTHGLVDDALALALPMLPLLATPLGTHMVGQVTAALTRAGIWNSAAPSIV